MVLHLRTQNVSKKIQYSLILKGQFTSQFWLTLDKLRPQHTSKYDSEKKHERNVKEVKTLKNEKKTQMQKNQPTTNQWKLNGTNVLAPGPGTKTPSEVHVLSFWASGKYYHPFLQHLVLKFKYMVIKPAY